MKKLHFDYSMELNYSEQVQKCYFTIKCIPQTTDRQKIEDLNVELEPRDSMEESVDSFGNRFLFGNVMEEHDRFVFRIRGTAYTGLADSEPLGDENILGAYRYPYGLTVPGKGLTEYFNGLSLQKERTAYETGVYLMRRLYEDFSYEKNVTDMNTTAEEAWQLGKGVCQDYAHILIVLCRMAGIPARYVAGMLIGEGYSHAWVEILSDDRWYALDPTNNCVVTDSHIRIGIGRDASDCLINRGVMTGGGRQSQDIRVIVRELPQEANKEVEKYG